MRRSGSAWRPRGGGGGGVALASSLLLLLSTPNSAAAQSRASAPTPAERPTLPPSPYDILQLRALGTPIVDVVPYCAPEDLDPLLDPALDDADAAQWQAARERLGHERSSDESIPTQIDVLDAVFEAREASDRSTWLDADSRLSELLRSAPLAPDEELCVRMERARMLLLLSREAEAGAQWTRAERILEAHAGNPSRAVQVAFGQAELLYRRSRPFEAHLAFRELSRVDDARIAAAARLRLVDLSFDAGNRDSVSIEYEALLPRASAFGASIEGWALRAAEAALDEGALDRALRWIELFVESSSDSDAREAATIRLADLDVAFDDPVRARERLRELASRRRRHPVGFLAVVRAIDLGVFEGPPAKRIELLLEAVHGQRGGVQRYALGVLMRERAHQGDLEGALAVATRLAYEGVDPVVNSGFEAALDALLTRATSEASDEASCGGVIRALGGRYGILIERASRSAPFLHVGACFERIELPWLAAPVYRSVARRFGVEGAGNVALPLARASLALGEWALPRRMAEASLKEPGPEADDWKAVLAETDFMESRFEAAARGLRAVLDSPRLESRRGHLARLLALTFETRRDDEGVRLLAERLPVWLESSGLGPRARADLIEATLRTAHAQREAGRLPAAHVLYRLVDRHAGAGEGADEDPGALRSSARFWLGLAGEPDAAGEPAWGADPEVELRTPWARLALFERRFDALARAYLGEAR